MSVSIQSLTAGQSLAAGGRHHRGFHGAKTSASSTPETFQQQVADVLKDGTRPASRAAARRESVTGSTASQNPVAAGVGSQAASLESTDPTTTPLTPLDALTQALQAAGLDPSRLAINVHDELVDNMGGKWVNHLITVTTPNGRIENFMADLTQKYPKVTVTEIQELMKLA